MIARMMFDDKDASHGRGLDGHAHNFWPYAYPSPNDLEPLPYTYCVVCGTIAPQLLSQIPENIPEGTELEELKEVVE